MFNGQSGKELEQSVVAQAKAAGLELNQDKRSNYLKRFLNIHSYSFFILLKAALLPSQESAKQRVAEGNNTDDDVVTIDYLRMLLIRSWQEIALDVVSEFVAAQPEAAENLQRELNSSQTGVLRSKSVFEVSSPEWDKFLNEKYPELAQLIK